MESFHITQNGNLKGTSYLPLILKTDIHKALPRRQLYHKKSAPALPSPGLSRGRNSEELHCADAGTKMNATTFTSGFLREPSEPHSIQLP